MLNNIIKMCPKCGHESLIVTKNKDYLSILCPNCNFQLIEPEDFKKEYEEDWVPSSKK